MKKISVEILILFVLGISIPYSSCVKKIFIPPISSSADDPELNVTHSIAELKNLPYNVQIDDDITVYGIVSMDDKSGNYFKKIAIQDETGGIEILLDQNNIYSDFPIGRKIYVKAKGLYLSEFNKIPQLGYTPDAEGAVSPIPYILINDFIVKANFPHHIIPDTVTLSALRSPDEASRYLNTLIAIKNVEFENGNVGIPYAQNSNIASGTYRTITDCDTGSIRLRTSGFATFQEELTPSGNGVLVGIYSRFNDIAQIFIRNTDDVSFNQQRCDGSSEPANPAVVSVDSIRNLFTGMEKKIGNYIIRGIVISDVENKNVASGNVVLQGGNDDKGIILYYRTNPELRLGDSIEVDITGAILKEYNGKLEIEGVQVEKTSLLATDKKIIPRVLTMAQILGNRKKYESTLVKILNVTWQEGAPTYGSNTGNLTISDGTATLGHYLDESSTFKDMLLPPSPVTSITAYVEVHHTNVQLRIRFPASPVFDVVP